MRSSRSDSLLLILDAIPCDMIIRMLSRSCSYLCYLELATTSDRFSCQNLFPNVFDDLLNNIMVYCWIEIQVILKEFFQFCFSILLHPPPITNRQHTSPHISESMLLYIDCSIFFIIGRRDVQFILKLVVLVEV